MCFQAFLNFWRNFRERFLELMRALISWLQQTFRNEPGNGAPSEAVSRASEITQLLVDTPQVEAGPSQSRTQNSARSEAHTLLNIPRRKIEKAERLGLRKRSHSEPVINRFDSIEKRENPILSQTISVNLLFDNGEFIVDVSKTPSEEKPAETISDKANNLRALEDSSLFHASPAIVSDSPERTNNSFGIDTEIISPISETRQLAGSSTITHQPSTSESAALNSSRIQRPSAFHLQRKFYIDSSESNSEGAVVIIERPIIHREDISDSTSDHNVKESAEHNEVIAENNKEDHIIEVTLGLNNEVTRELNQGRNYHNKEVVTGHHNDATGEQTDQILATKRFLEEERRRVETSIPIEQESITQCKYLSESVDIEDHQKTVICLESKIEQSVVEQSIPHSYNLFEDAQVLGSEIEPISISAENSSNPLVVAAERLLEENQPLLTPDSISLQVLGSLEEDEPLLSPSSIAADNSSAESPLSIPDSKSLEISEYPKKENKRPLTDTSLQTDNSSVASALLIPDSISLQVQESSEENKSVLVPISVTPDNSSGEAPLASAEDLIDKNKPLLTSGSDPLSLVVGESLEENKYSLSSNEPPISWNSEEFRNHLYENDCVIKAQRRRRLYHESQSTSKDVNSDILDSDSIFDKGELSEAGSLQFVDSLRASPSLVQFSEPENLFLGNSGQAEVSQSSDPNLEFQSPSSGEANQALLDSDIVSEEIQEEERYIAEHPEVDNKANNAVLLTPNIQKTKLEKSYKDLQSLSEIFIQTEHTETLRYNSDSVKHLTEKFLVREICSEESIFSNTLCDSSEESDKMPVKMTKSDKCSSKKSSSETQQQVRVLTLNRPGFQDSTLYRLKKDWIIEFRLGPTLFGRKVSIHCNYPREEVVNSKTFERDTYHILEWKRNDDCENSDDTALYAQILCKIPGNFHYYYTQDGSNADKEVCGSGYFLVDPTIWFGQEENLPLDCIQCQTIISKQLGSFSTWPNKLEVTKETSYNMVHFTPVQELGESNSAYSLKDQLHINSSFKKDDGMVPTWEELKSFIRKMNREWKVASICDIVLNHTANDSPWIQEHPDATYNCENCRYMRPAYLLDASLHQFCMDIKNGLYETKGIPIVIDSEDHLNAIRYHLLEGLFKVINIHELYMCDVNKYVSQFLDAARQTTPEKETLAGVAIQLIQDPDYKRLASSVDLNLAMKIYNIYRPGCFDEDTRLRKSCEEFKQKLDSLNKIVIDKIQEHLNTAVDNIIAGIKYWRVSPDGPRLKEITIANPLIPRYFTDYDNSKNMKDYEEIMYSDNGKYLMAHNGWIMNGDPLVNFAGPQSNVYIRRELIAWGDSVKLRFGEKPSDSPYLWEHMRKYVELTASIFDGVRLDNCHSTPIHVAQYLLDCARKVRPDLYVVAELFTNSDEKDNIFVNSLGISSLIREAMNSSNSHEQGRLVHRFGGIPVGSFYQPNTRPLVPSIAHALFLDLTHDNPSPIEKTSVFNLLTTSALVNMACCGTGSNRGYDELVPHQISVVDEIREYTEWSTRKEDEDNSRYVSAESGIIAAKKALNELHYYLGSKGFNQIYVDQMDPDIVAVTRHCPVTHESYIMVAFTAFNDPGGNDDKWQRSIRPLRVEGVLDEVVMEATLSHADWSDESPKYPNSVIFEENSSYINGLSEYKISIKNHVQLKESDVFEEIASNNSNEIALHFKNFKPGSVVIIKVSLSKAMKKVVAELRNLMDLFSNTEDNELKQLIKKLSLSDLNRVLYRCDQEERDEGNGFNTYAVPNFGNLVYSGLQGFISLLSKIRPNNDLGHPMCENLRQGNWMIDYIYQRLKLDEGTKELGIWIENNTEGLKVVPRYLKPAYFDMLFTGVYLLLLEHAYSSMPSFVNKGSIFVKYLALGSLQFAAFIKSADLPTLSPKLAQPTPPVRVDQFGKKIQACVSLSAGLPHFSVGYMRNWGRDTFIALRGLFILTGRYQEARYHILGYGACLRHGLIPNLLDGGRKPRFNCRDAVWWWLYCIKCYVEQVPNGIEILEDKVSRIFPTDESPPHQPGETDQILQDVMQEALNRHFQGVTFRERNAGREIDEHMTDNGFNNRIGVHPETGFVFGGNVDNCGTWMDKMGSSQKAGNQGKPATPRDGSACEIVGLSKAVISWLASLNERSIYKYEGVERQHSNGNLTKWSFKYWSDKIHMNFEKYYWVNEEPTTGEIRPDLINKRGIYKDCYGATQEWTDFQLRCNFPIVMVVAPELFDPQHGWTALQLIEKHLVGPLGMKTLDPSDWAYRGDYDNSNDSNDPTVAHGFNYHQGPEWLWPLGYYFRAKIYFAAKNNKLKETIAEIKCKLANHFSEIQTSDWKGLPELTNSNGSYCRDSSRTQAWSMSSILEVLHDLQQVESLK